MYVTKGIKVDKEGNGPELMFLGNVSYCTKNNRFQMLKPEMLIGTDRLELYEFMAHRNSVKLGLNRNWLKLAVAATAIHATIV